MKDVAVAIVGGGISGLSAAYELDRRHVPFVLLEKSARLGGVIRTERAGGFTIDAGPDALLVHKPAALELCAELGLERQLIPTLPPRTAYVVRDATLHPLPPGSVLGVPTRIGPLAANRVLSWRGRVRMGLDLAVPRAAHHAQDAHDESVAAFFRRRFGKEAVAYVADPLLGGIHAGDVERLSMRALFPQFVEAERSHGSVIRAFRRVAADRAAQGDRDGQFRALADGLEALPRAIATRLAPGAVRTETGVTGLTAGSGSGNRRYALCTSDGARIAADQVICALPAHAAAPLLAGLDEDAGRLCGSIGHTSVAIVFLAWPRAAVRHPLDGTGFVVPRAETGLSITAATWISSKWPGRVQEGHVLLRGFVGGMRTPEALEQTDDALVTAVQRDLALLLGIDGEPLLARVYRWPLANPQPDVGHLDRVAAIDARLKGLPGLHVIGAAFRGVGVPDCVAAGRAAGRAAAAAVEASGAGRVATAQDYP